MSKKNPRRENLSENTLFFVLFILFPDLGKIDLKDTKSGHKSTLMVPKHITPNFGNF